MDRNRRALILATLLTSMLLVTAPAQACQDLIFYPVERHIEASLAVVHVRVKSTRVVQLSSLGVACDVLSDVDSCKIVEVGVEVLEEFKNLAGTIQTVHTPSVPEGMISCDMEPFSGEEYVLFLHQEGDTLRNHQPSFVVVSRYIPYDLLKAHGLPDKLEALRCWKSAQQN